eukprot:TRINITY_DN7661_c2_g1_i1.p1 TRINITY_DN7661_c2_g1~~TRINITY_DN7661_c2_g1_i1.p1  ORF type:complete len:439 (+),score=160.98 TRINITY_DN7661_c2_g1_i1:1132-2448(+)
MAKAVIYICLLAMVAFRIVSASPNGLGRLPPMGWNTWCTMGPCCQDGLHTCDSLHDFCYEGEVKAVAQAIIDNGMQAAGYEYINLDDCWAAESRAADGSIQADPDRFPYGIKELVDWLHARNFKFGLYTSAGFQTCSSGGRPDPIPGSYGHYDQDAATFASWGVDYVKLDWCNTHFPNGSSMDPQLQTDLFWQAMNKTNVPMWLNFHCDQPANAPPPPNNTNVVWPYCIADGDSFRIGSDHHDYWPNTLLEISELVGLGKYGGPGHWNDPDFLMTGGAGCNVNQTLHCPGQTDDEYRTEMSIWAIASAPLIVSTDIRNMTAIMQEVLLNKELIAVDQDPLGKAGDQLSSIRCGTGNGVNGNGTCQVWGKPLADGSWVVGLLNLDDFAAFEIVADFSLIGRSGAVLRARDLWTHQELGQFTGSFSSKVSPHATVVVKLY